MIDKALEERMDYAQRITSLTLSLRKKHRMRVRQPLSKNVIASIGDEAFIEQVDASERFDFIGSEYVKEMEYITDTSGIIKKKIKPNFKTLGRRLGRNMKEGKKKIENLTPKDIATLEATGKLDLEIGGQNFEITAADLVITSEDIEGWLVANDADLTVALDVNLTPELLAEGTAREMVNRIQNIRKDKDFDVMDRITLTVQKNEAIAQAVQEFGTYICNEVLADALTVVDTLEGGETVELTDGVVIQLLVQR